MSTAYNSDPMDAPVDKILAALTPALSAEIERLLHDTRQDTRQETRQELESEFQAQQERAVQDAESALRASLETEKADAVAAAREALNGEFAAKYALDLQNAMDQVRADFGAEAQDVEAKFAADKTVLASEIAAVEGDRARLESEISRLREENTELREQALLWRTYAEAQREIGDSGSQAEMLNRFLKLAEPFAASIAVYVAKPGGLELWKSRGAGPFPSVLPDTGADMYCQPLVVRDKTVVAICAHEPYKADALDYLSACLGRAIEAFGLKLRTPSPGQPVSSR